MTAPWFEIDAVADRMPPPLDDRYRLEDPWGEWAIEGELIPITFAGTTTYGRALVTGHDERGCAVVLPLDPTLVLIHSDPPVARIHGRSDCRDGWKVPSRAGGGGVAAPPPPIPLPDQGVLHRSSGFSTGDEAS